ncbi:MAG TPA: hypothetical protein VN455_02020, partial [Methanotrichaceae archaeon]|nr:hypothetical protein [Methanotrichaceae archaeon]
MKLIHITFILFLLACTASAQLAVDKNTFDIELHPGDVQIKTIVMKNLGTAPIFDITTSPVGGDAKEFLFVEVQKIDRLDPEVKDNKDKQKNIIPVICATPPDAKPGNYSGFIYIFDNTPPSVPIPIEFNVRVLKPESYGLSLFVDDAKSAHITAKPDEAAKLDLSVRNLGQFRDVALIDATSVPQGWSVTLLDNDNPVDLPYKLPIPSDESHSLTMEVKVPQPGVSGEVEVTAVSMGNMTKNSTVKAQVDFGVAIRGYEVKVDMPEVIAVNKTYRGTFMMSLDVNERIKVGINTPPELLVIPTTEVMYVSPSEDGKANFTLLATEPGRYGIVFKLVDSNGVPMPEELALVTAFRPKGTVILTGDGFMYSTLATLDTPGNNSTSVVTLPDGKLDEKSREGLLSYSKLIILGNESVISPDIERTLSRDVEVKRISGESICETSWRFISEMWENGTAEIVMSGPKEIDIFKAYQEAKNLNLPLVICDSGPTDSIKSIVEDLMKRKTKLSRIHVIGEVDKNTTKTLAGMGITVEGVTL